MTMVALASAKAAPGVTTATLAVGAVWPADDWHVVIAECDPAGGDLAAWFGIPASPGLVSLAPVVRRASSAELTLAHCQTLPGGLRALLGPVAAEQAGGALGILPPRLLGELDADRRVLWLADCGRLTPHSPALAVARQASLLLLVARPVAAELGHLAALVGWVRPRAQRLGLVLVGDGPYRHAEISAALGVGVLGVLPTDARAATVVSGAAPPPRRPHQLPLLRAARQLAARLHQDVLTTPPRPPTPATFPGAPAALAGPAAPAWPHQPAPITGDSNDATPPALTRSRR